MKASDILRQLHETATKREWALVDCGDFKELWSNGEILATFYGENADADIDLVIRMRNVLPEHLRSIETMLWYIDYYRNRMRIAQGTAEGDRCPNCDAFMGHPYFAENHYVAPAGEYTCRPTDWRSRALAAETAMGVREAENLLRVTKED